MPTREDFKRMVAPILRGTTLGSFLGILPGGGAMLSSFAAYSLEKKVSRYSAEFGQGAIEGVAGPESANNAGAQASFIPMLTLGIPSNPVMALMIGALIMHGIQPGPGVMVEQPALFWGLVVSMWIGNLFLLVLNLPLIGIWVKMISVPYQLLFPAILVFCAIGVFSLSNAQFDIYLMALFGILGYVFRKLGCEPAPMMLGFILGPMMEEYLRRALLMKKGSAMVFVTRPDQRNAARHLRHCPGHRPAPRAAHEARGSVSEVRLPCRRTRRTPASPTAFARRCSHVNA